MTLRQSLSYLLLLAALCSYAQDKPATVFITNPSPDGKQAKTLPVFGQFSISLPVRATPHNSETDDYEYTNTVFDYILPDGLSANFGGGLHLNSWTGISANTGIDWIGSEKLVVVPIYGSVFLNPAIHNDYSLLLQFGYGYSFALGRGDLSGTFQKYRLGVVKDDSVSLYLELNQYGFPLHKMDPAGSIAIGICFFDFW
jgi:hypothetical protein